MARRKTPRSQPCVLWKAQQNQGCKREGNQVTENINFFGYQMQRMRKTFTLYFKIYKVTPFSTVGLYHFKHDIKTILFLQFLLVVECCNINCSPVCHLQTLSHPSYGYNCCHRQTNVDSMDVSECQIWLKLASSCLEESLRIRLISWVLTEKSNFNSLLLASM